MNKENTPPDHRPPLCASAFAFSPPRRDSARLSLFLLFAAWRRSLFNPSSILHQCDPSLRAVMDDWNKPFTDEELSGIDTAIEAAATSFTTPSSSSDCCRFPCFTNSSKPALAPHRSSAEPNCNGQWRCSSRKTFSSRSFLAAKDSSKWPFYREPRMSSHVGSLKRLLEDLERHACSSTVRFQKKRPRVVPMAVEEAWMARKWDEMDHDILVTIMKCLVQGSYSVQAETLYRPFLVCKSWRSAVLDSLFPPGNVLDLQFLEAAPKREKCYYQLYLKFLLQCPHQYTKLIVPDTNFKNGADTYIAQRLSTLKCLVTSGLPYFSVYNLVPYWPEINEAHCHVTLTQSLSVHCKFIRRLDLSGRIGDDKARTIAYHFSHLIHLSIQSCILSLNALSIILQGHPHLSYLDSRHAFCIKGPIHLAYLIKDPMCGPIKGRVIEWDEEEVLQKSVGVKTYLYCARKFCSYCAPLYLPNISDEDLRRFSRS